MKYKSCDLIEHGLDFAPDSINFCCRTTTEGGGFKTLIDNYHGELLNLDEFFKLKREYRNKMKTGEGIPECENCIYLEDKDYDDDDYISSINFNHGLNCNCKCIYCTFTHGEKATTPEYDVYPVIKQLSDNGYLKKGGYITIAGGEPTLYRNFEKLMRLFMQNEIKPIRVLTNGLRYSDAISEALQNDFANILISVDSGSPEMYKWVKGLDGYDRVWANISKYLSFQKMPDLVKTKYIIIPTVNDSKTEILNFIEKSQAVGVYKIAFDVELTWYDENKHKIPDELYELVEFSVEETQKRNMLYEPVDRVVSLLKKIKEDKNYHISFRGQEI